MTALHEILAVEKSLSHARQQLVCLVNLLLMKRNIY